jgi:arylsulfatase A-like enzyme
MKTKSFLTTALSLLLASLAAAADKPNIVWIVVDDMSPHFACYGETAIKTPNVDSLAAVGTRFSKAFVTAPICSICRSALITGRYQTSIGCQNHRSGSAKFPITLPADTPVVPQLLRKAGYHCSNVSVDHFLRTGEETSKPTKVAKTDYNFVWDGSATYETTHWAKRTKEQPFFAAVQLAGGKHRGQGPGPKWLATAKAALGSVTPENAFKLPAYLPEDPTIRADWAQYLDCVRYTDWEVGRIVERLKEAGEWERTVLIFFTDHGISHVRNKQFLYDVGTQVPMVMAGPGIAAGKVRDDLVEHIDIAAVSLSLAGIERPATMQGKDVLAKDYAPRKYTFAARDRADETVDRIRSVRSDQWKYIRNFYPSRPYLQPNRYKDNKAVVQTMRKLHEEKKLTPEQSLIMAETRPKEELYDLKADPFELRNLAEEPAQSATLAEMRGALQDWIVRTDDKGRDPESEEVYLNYVTDERPEGGKSQVVPEFLSNIELMKRWTKEKPMDSK